MYKATQAHRRKIWAVAREHGLKEEQVRDIVFAITGQGSTGDISVQEAMMIIDRITGQTNNAGGYVNYNTKADAERKGNAITTRQIWKINQFLQQLGWADDQKRIEGFIKKYANVDKLHWLTKSQATNIIDALKNMLKEQQKKSNLKGGRVWLQNKTNGLKRLRQGCMPTRLL